MPITSLNPLNQVNENFRDKMIDFAAAEKRAS